VHEEYGAVNAMRLDLANWSSPDGNETRRNLGGLTRQAELQQSLPKHRSQSQAEDPHSLLRRDTKEPVRDAEASCDTA
jgi:hypothetical protein